MKYFLLFLILSSTAFASCEEYTRFGVPVKICWKEEFRALVNNKCDKNCLATDFVKKHYPKPKLQLTGGKNPASAKCLHYDLRVIVLKDPRGAEQSFCEFSDGSLIDSNAVARSMK